MATRQRRFSKVLEQSYAKKESIPDLRRTSYWVNGINTLQAPSDLWGAIHRKLHQHGKTIRKTYSRGQFYEINIQDNMAA